MEKMLNLYIEYDKKKKQPMTNCTVRGKALSIYERLCSEDNVDRATEPFTASDGWKVENASIYANSLYATSSQNAPLAYIANWAYIRNLCLNLL